MRRHLITGGLGFIAVNLAARLRRRGDQVLLLDNLSRGRRANLGALACDHGVAVAVADCVDPEAVARAAGDAGFAEADEVWHLAANSDIPAGLADLRLDACDTLLTTTGVLEAMRALGLRTLNFASSSAVYGDSGAWRLDETSGPLEPISNYGAMKLASEAQIRAACESFIGTANVFRFPNVVGVPATHGVLLDFVRKLRRTPRRLEVLGDGAQRKPYLHVADLVDAMLFAVLALGPGRHVLNIGPPDDGITVREIAALVTAAVAPGAEIVFGTGKGGWVGDVPRVAYSLERLHKLGWRGERGSEAAIRLALAEVVEQEQGALCNP
ncbi:MAG TPA: NAD-dependent epimerase/dehydratase family protein [Myxococcales bacterium]